MEQSQQFTQLCKEEKDEISIKNGKGLLLCLGLAIPSCILGKMFPVIGGPVFAILIGMVLALVVKKKEPFEGGVKFTSKKFFSMQLYYWDLE